MRDRTTRKAPQAAGMIVSNELGYYKTGEYGIRIENPVLVARVRLTARRALGRG
jgi:Xaa-Pro aminopeptidase